MTANDFTPLSLPKLLLFTVLAGILAVILLIVVVFPAEFNRDYTGLGTKMGLNKLAEVDSATGRLSNRHKVPARVETQTVNLEPGEAIELKAIMDEGDSLLYEWSSNATVYFNLHGEPTGPGAQPGAYRNYETGLTDKDQGSFTAAFLGTLGWYWRNESDQPVTINLKATGYFEPFKEM